MIGHNTTSGEALRGYVERIERLNEEKAGLQADISAIFAEAKANGFDTATIRRIVKRRKMKPADAQDADTLFDTYLHALGMASEAPLFRHVGLMKVDLSAREAVIGAFKTLVPPGGEIIVKVGAPVRLWRDKDGAPQVEDYTEPSVGEPVARSGRSSPARTRPEPPARTRPEPPAVDEDGAESLGRAAARENKAVIENPFPWDDKRRARWDEGWRKELGTDGMGPPDE